MPTVRICDPSLEYELLHSIGTGGFSCVFLATSRNLGEFVAVKVIPVIKSGCKRQLNFVKNEVMSLMMLPHNIKFKELYKWNDNFYVIFELATFPYTGSLSIRL